MLVDELAPGVADAGDGEGGEQGSGQGEGTGAGAEAAREDPGAGDGEGDRRDPDEPLGGLFVLLDRVLADDPLDALLFVFAGLGRDPRGSEDRRLAAR